MTGTGVATTATGGVDGGGTPVSPSTPPVGAAAGVAVALGVGLGSAVGVGDGDGDAVGVGVGVGVGVAVGLAVGVGVGLGRIVNLARASVPALQPPSPQARTDTVWPPTACPGGAWSKVATARQAVGSIWMRGPTSLPSQKTCASGQPQAVSPVR